MLQEVGTLTGAGANSVLKPKEVPIGAFFAVRHF